MAVTIYEIAEKAGVSASTVSRVLRGTMKESWKSSSERAQRIRRVAEELGYRPNLVARAFSQQKTMGIGLISGENGQIFEPVNREIVLSICEKLGSHGYHLVIVPFDDTSHWRDLLLGRRLDGCFLLNFVNDEIAQVLVDSQLPALQISERTESPFPLVEPEDYGGAYKACRHLLGLGHRNIIFYVNEEIRPHFSVDERLRGLHDAIADFNEPATLFEHLYESERDLINSLIAKKSKATAVVAYCDYEAVSLAHNLPKYGIRIPQDLSLLGFNDVYPTELMSPPLTMVGYDTKQTGEVAAELMLSQIARKDEEPSDDLEESEGVPDKTVIEQQIVLRGSTGPVPAVDT